jgi:peptidoglycan/LPS O-acetylase OafA/YrhL
VTRPATPRGFRSDIQGLRALAVGLVVLYHADVPGLTGGYAGVDVFFVISGFLITGLIIRELERTGRVALGAFWARRIRRLLPTAALVLVVTLVASRFLLPPLQLLDLRSDGIATALYSSNLWFAHTSTDYLAGSAPSPFQHYWSLAVEEQFYLFWPLLLLLVAVVLKRWLKPAVLVLVALVGAASFGLCVVLTTSHQPIAFFTLPTRAWELAAGGLLAAAFANGLRLPRAVAVPTAWLGVVIVLGVGFVYTDSTTFPGAAAALPVLGSMLVLLGGEGHAGGLSADRLLRLPPLQYVGNTSYSLYLWHWPVLVLPAADRIEPLPGWARALLVGLSLLLAAASYELVEQRFRTSRFLTLRTYRSYAAGLGLTAVALTATLLVAILPQLDNGRPAPALAAPVAAGTLPTAVPSNLRPTLEDVADDLPAVYANGCHRGFAATTSPRCVFGDRTATRTMVLMGDSHAAQWFPALDQVAKERHYRLESFTKSSCPTADVRTVQVNLKRDYHECDAWRENVLDRIAAEQPELVVMANYKRVVTGTQSTVSEDDWAAGMARTLARIPDGTQVVVLGDTPDFLRSGPDCLSKHIDDPARCAEARDRAVEPDHEVREREAIEADGARYVSTAAWLCPDAECQVLYGDLLLYRDRSHLTTQMAAALAGVLGQAVLGV